ncbi:MAG: SDR family NAD(P)-dependent oxidoreductase [Anaerolineae bacterium]
MQNLQGKNALLTGGSRGIGPAIAQALARKGVNLALVARSAEQLAAVAQEVSLRGVRAVPIPADISDPAARSALLTRAEAELGPLDLLINNAAIEQVSPFVRQETQDIGRIIETNLTAPMVLTRLVLPGMLQRGRGHIVNIASIAGKKAPPYNAVYGATKAGLIEWTGGLRGELEGTGVSASVVCPGFIAEAVMFVDHYSGQSAPG